MNSIYPCDALLYTNTKTPRLGGNSGVNNIMKTLQGLSLVNIYCCFINIVKLGLDWAVMEGRWIQIWP